MRTRVIGALVFAALVAAACGGRMSDQQIAAEAAEDARLGGRGGGNGFAAGGDGGTADDGSIDGLGSTDGVIGSTDGSSDDGGGDVTSTTSGGGSRDNGGATDVGVTADRIILGNVSTLTGPVPGLFRGALVGAQAWAAMINSQGGIDGRLIEIRSGDDGLDSGRNKAAHLALKNKVFGFLGSFSVNDDGSVSELRGSGIPDVGFALSAARTALANNYSPSPLPPGWRGGPPNWFVKRFGLPVVKKTAMFVSSVESARATARWHRSTLEAAGWEVVYTREVRPNEPNYTGDVIQMRQEGVRTVVWQGQADQMAEMASTMHEQGFEVDLANWGGDAYSSVFIDLAGKDAAEGTLIDLTWALFLGEDAGRIPEIRLFNQWMKQVDPRQRIDLFGMYAWTAGRLLEGALRAAGPKITRENVLAALSKVTSFNGNGILAPTNPAGKKPSDCFLVVRITNGKFVREAPKGGGFICNMGGFRPYRG